MKLSIKICTLDMPYDEMLDFCVRQGMEAWKLAQEADPRGALYRSGRHAVL